MAFEFDLDFTFSNSCLVRVFSRPRLGVPPSLSCNCRVGLDLDFDFDLEFDFDRALEFVLAFELVFDFDLDMEGEVADVDLLVAVAPVAPDNFLAVGLPDMEVELDCSFFLALFLLS